MNTKRILATLGIGAASLAIINTVPAAAGGRDMFAVDGSSNYAINIYTDENCSLGHDVWRVGDGHARVVHSFKVNAYGWFQTNVPGKTGHYSYQANTCRPINLYAEWSDTHVAALEHG